MDLSKEIEIAKNARKNAYVPYTKYYVGCALKTSSGKIYSGCNIQNQAIQSYCAERVAFLKAISEGERNFEYIVVCGGSSDILDNCLPCGYCRQFMSEFVNENFKIYALSENDKITEYSIEDLLPHGFKF
jgi:cytidine deaminase